MLIIVFVGWWWLRVAICVCLVVCWMGFIVGGDCFGFVVRRVSFVGFLMYCLWRVVWCVLFVFRCLSLVVCCLLLVVCVVLCGVCVAWWLIVGWLVVVCGLVWIGVCVLLVVRRVLFVVWFLDVWCLLEHGCSLLLCVGC